MNAIQQIIGWMPALLQATGVTLALSVTSVLTALVLAVFLALGKISKNTVLRSVCGAYIFFFRGTPLLMQLFFLYYTLPQLVPAFNIQSRFLAAWIAFSLNVAAYLAEIIRAAGHEGILPFGDDAEPAPAGAAPAGVADSAAMKEESNHDRARCALRVRTSDRLA